ncbi:hypothetical protein Srubr_36810 [Streptomyces rubradiris]|uniref:Uncharacterized protein n=1 Tax=Streptomyces rubradiris TaxID=285531 RepID=A0ABQ3RDD8_STRRR|nr:hypothetical protein GCM10018792_05730 [Streptomyces rubradiris]GHI53835.1 hypothetical protein Srubr_36810 [Streptomyces rubradiris]
MTSPPPAGGAGQPMSGTRAEAVARERERLRALRERREALSADAGVDGFTIRRWRKVGVFGAQAVLQAHALLQQLASLARDATHDALADALRDEPDDRLLPAVRTVLERANPAIAAATLTAIHAGGFLWMSEFGEQRLTALTAGDDALVVSGSEDPSGAFALLTAFATDGTATFPPRMLPRVLPWIPLSVLDDLIDAEVVGPEHQPWQYRTDEARHAYLKARLVPDQVTAEQAAALEWTTWQRRNAFLAGGEPLPSVGDVYDLLELVADGDASVVKELERELPRDLVLRLRRILGGVNVGNWDRDIWEDRGLWRLIFSLWEPKAAVNPSRSPMHALMALRQAYALLCLNDLARASSQIDKLVSFETADPAYRAEALNFHAYTLLLRDELNAAAIVLKGISRSNELAESNLRMVEQRRAVPRNDRLAASNPYLDLGLPHGAPSWETRYRDLRREHMHDVDMSARLNSAMKRIRDAERDEDWSGFFVLPLDPDVFELPDEVPVTLVPPLAPLTRRTTPHSPESLALVRQRAVADLLPHLLNAPRRPDRNSRMHTQ